MIKVRRKAYLIAKVFSMSVQSEKKASKESPSSKSTTNSLKSVKFDSAYLDNDSSSTGSTESASSIQIVKIVKGKDDSNNKTLKERGLSKSLRKKFFHHFHNVDEDEEVLNRFSCALLNDLMLQGYLYVTTNYFGFYSNVFGYVTKILIPILTVEDITKEKTAKIFPNAIGIVTAEQKHVFGSLMSRDSSLEFLRKVWEKAKSEAELLEKEISEQGLDYSDLENEPDKSSEEEEDQPNVSSRNVLKGPRTVTYFKKITKRRVLLSATTVLLIILYLSATLLLYRISKMQDKYTIALQNVDGSDASTIYRDIMNWQVELHSKADSAAYNYLDSNLNQIAQVKESLKALSSLLVDARHSNEGSNKTPQIPPNS